MKLSIIGTGLIGGSMALSLRQLGFAQIIYGVEQDQAHAARAIELGLVNEVCPLSEAIQNADLVVIAIPVDAVESILPTVLNLVDQQVVMDVGSIKGAVVDSVKDHPKRGRFVATHPMWGTEYSGPSAAVPGGFKGKATVICDKEHSDEDALQKVLDLYAVLGMHPVFMDAGAHDLHVAYISHISHITSFALANTVLQKEKEENTIFELASGGFESTVRLAKSNADMWVPVMMQNRENILDVLNEHLSQLRKFKACLEKENEAYLRELILDANGIRRIIR